MEDRFELLLWVPSERKIIYCQDGSGDQLDYEDYEAGNNAYIDYKISEMNGDDAFEEGDGGIFMYNNDNVSNWQDMIPNMLESEFGYVPKFIKLEMED